MSQYGGEISVDSVFNEGSTFTFTFEFSLNGDEAESSVDYQEARPEARPQVNGQEEGVRGRVEHEDEGKEVLRPLSTS